MSQIVLGFGVASAIAVVAYVAGSLSPSGAAATVVVGTVTFGWGGVAPAVLLVLFFTTSSALTRFRKSRKSATSPGFSKGGRRDHGQVLANGIVPAICSFLIGTTGEGIWLAGVVGSLGAVTADTWGTELGVLSAKTPRLITNGARVPPGTSGGVTLPGTLSGILGAGLIGVTGAIIAGDIRWVVVAMIAGTAGMFLDSLLGATVQVMYACPHCELNTEQHPIHNCGTPTHRVRGVPWINNDVVNLISALIGAVVAGLSWVLAVGT